MTICLAIWAVVVGLLVLLAAIPQYRSPWLETVAASPSANGHLVAEPLTDFNTPFVSHLTVEFPRAIPAPDDLVAVHLIDDGRVLATLDATRQHDAPRVFRWSGTRARQFKPSDALLVEVVVPGETASELLGAPATITFGHVDESIPAVVALRFWWPWIGTLFGAGVLALCWRPTHSTQGALVSLMRNVVADHRALWILLAASAGIRAVLLLNGGQYLDWDETRYGVGATTFFGRLSTGNLTAALDVLLASPDHPGFRIMSLVPALAHVASAWFVGQPISAMQRRSGEWLPAFIFAMASVACIGLTYATALRAGASRQAAFIAALVLAASVTMVLYARQFLPYDIAMALLLGSLWLGLTRSTEWWRPFLVGFLAGCGFLTYTGFWLLVIVVAVAHAGWSWPSFTQVTKRAGLLGIGGVTPPLTLVVLDRIHRLAAGGNGPSFSDGLTAFSRTVVNGDFSEGWSLPWAAFWHAEHALLVVVAIGIVLALSGAWKSAVGDRRVAVLAVAGCALIYGGLTVGSVVLERFVVYDRTARQMLPFLCVAAGMGLSPIVNTRRRTLALAALAAALFVSNAWPLFAFPYPRDVALQVLRTYGPNSARTEPSLAGATDITARLFVPESFTARQDPSGEPTRFVLLNAMDIWTDSAFGKKPLPPGTVVRSVPHPRQWRSLQYHGYTREQRAFIRSVDLSVRLIDTASE